MYVPFDTLPADSRIWIYQANRPLTASEKEVAVAALEGFCESWTAHQHALKTSFTIEHDQFIVLATDEDYHQPSGCSIDSSVRALKDLQDRIGLDFFDRSRVAFLVNGQVTTHSLPRLKAVFEAGELNPGTLTFDNLVPSRGDLAQRWKTPVEKTWLAKYLPDSTLVSNRKQE
ncbi:MAG TPA: hypothetical protein VK508_10130 [Cyclobacteriaceae bacterium]|nr:hypothetical protein [Cyclobacteriaceae bacterium]